MEQEANVMQNLDTIEETHSTKVNGVEDVGEAKSGTDDPESSSERRKRFSKGWREKSTEDVIQELLLPNKILVGVKKTVGENGKDEREDKSKYSLEENDAIQFVDSLCAQLIHDAPPLVPDLSNLKRVLNLPDDILLVRVNDLVRKSMDEMAFGIHYYVLITLIHSSFYCYVHKRGKNQRKPIRFFTNTRWDKEKRRMEKLESPKEIWLEIEETKAPGGKFLSLRYLEEYFENVEVDLRPLLNHIIGVNTMHSEPYNFFYRGKAEPYYPPLSVERAKSIRGLANFFSHRNGVVPRTVPAKVPHGVFFEEVSERDAFVALKLADQMTLWCSELSAHASRIVGFHYPDRRTMSLYRNGDRWIFGFLRGLVQAIRSHFGAVASICENLKTMFGDHFKAELNPSLSEEVTDKDMTLGKLLGELKEAVMTKRDARTTQFALIMLWTRFGCSLEEDSGTSGDTGSVASAEGSMATMEEGDETDEDEFGGYESDLETPKFGMVDVKRFEIVDQTVTTSYNMTFTAKRIQPRTEFLIDPFGITHLDLIQRMLDVALLGLRHVLVRGACIYSQNLVTGKLEETPMILAHVVEELLKQKSAKELKEDTDAMKFLGEEEFKKANVAILYEPTTNRMRREHFRRFVRRPDVLKVIKEGHWTTADLIPNYVRYQPQLADPRYIAEFLRRLKHPQTDVPLFEEEAASMIDIRDRAMHHYHLVPTEHYDIGQLYTYLDNLCDFVIKLANLMCLPEFGDLHEVKALREMKSFIGHYKRWRGRQQAAFSMSLETQLDVAHCTVEDLYKALDVKMNTLQRPIRPSRGVKDGSTQALHLLLKIFYKKKFEVVTNTKRRDSVDSSANMFGPLSYGSIEEDFPSDIDEFGQDEHQE